MSVPSMRSPRPTSATSYQSSSPRLPSPLNPSPDSFSYHTGHTRRNSPVGEMSDTLSPLRERLDSGLISSPRPSLGGIRPRTSSFSCTPRSCTSPERSPVTAHVPPPQPYGARARYPSPSSSPFSQAIPLPSSSPLPSSPLAGLQSPMSHSPRAISPSNSARQCSPTPCHSNPSQFQPRPLCSPPHLSQSNFHIPQGSPVQIMPPSHFPRAQSVFQQSMGNHNTAQLVPSPPESIRNRRVSMDAEPRPRPFTYGGPVSAVQSFAQDMSSLVKGDSTPLNEAPIRWWGGRRGWLDDWDHAVQQSQANYDALTTNFSGHGELDSAMRMHFVQPGHENPLLFRNDEIRASLGGIGDTVAHPNFLYAPSDANAGYEIEGTPFSRAVPVPIVPGITSSGVLDGRGYDEPPPTDGGLVSQRTQVSITHRDLQGNENVRMHDGIVSLQGLEHGHDEHGHSGWRNRRFSNASTRSSTSYASCMSGPSQSHSQSLLMASSQSHTSTYPSLSSLGIGMEEAEREELRSRTFWARRNSGSTLKRQSKDAGHDTVAHNECLNQASPSIPNNGKYGLYLNGPEERVDNAATADAEALSHEKVTVKHGSIFWRGSKRASVSDEQAQWDSYSRAEKCVSLAITSILPAATIAALSPVGQALIKARDSAVFAGRVLAPVAKDTLTLSADLLSCAPLPGLEEAAKALLSVWDACQKMDTNRLSCLRLAERCATLLYSVRWDIEETGCQATLAEPVERLCSALVQIQKFLDTQLHRPFLKRYVRREEIARELQACNDAITDAVSRFGISVQVRTYNGVCLAAFDAQRLAHETQAMLSLDRQLILEQREMWRQLCMVVTESSGENTTPPPPYGPFRRLLPMAAAPTADGLTSDEVASGSEQNALTSCTSSSENPHDVVLTVSTSPTPTPSQATFTVEETKMRTLTTETVAMTKHPEKVRQALKEVHLVQDSVDAAADEAALRGTLAGALDTNNDVEIVRCLQVARGEIPEAAETLRRMLDAGPTNGNALEDAAHSSDMGEKLENRLDRKFIQSGFQAMMRLTNVVAKQPHGEGDSAIGITELPSWTITRYEVLRIRKIGMGFFSDVYLGHWRKLTVAIKVLTHSVSREAFVRYVELWNALDHPNVLPLYGASSAVGERPWFLVSKFCGGDNLVTSLKRARAAGTMAVGNEATVRVDLLRFIYEIARGMAYLHGCGVSHGALRAANVLVDENGRCVLSDFGQCEIKSEAHQSCGKSRLLQWRAPEMLMSDGQPTKAGDVYAFSVCCVEILGMGDLPWATLDDKTIHELVMDKDERPSIPVLDGFSDVANAITDLVQSCWVRQPDLRPSFLSVVASLEGILTLHGHGSIQIHCASPTNIGTALDTSTESSPADEFYETASESMRTEVEEEATSDMVDISLTSPAPVLGNTCSGFHAYANKFVKITTQPTSSTLEHHDNDTPTPSPTNRLDVDAKNEENYRLIAGSNHVFHNSLALPLWSPTRVELGAVGYLSKPKGEFITLFNAIDPLQSCDERLRQLPSMYGYGKFEVQRREEGKRNVAQRGLDAISGFLTFKTRGDRSSLERIARQYAFPLVKGTPSAHLCVEKTVHRYIDHLEVPTKWFKQNVGLILEVCAPLYAIQREDLVLVVGTLDAPDWAMFVSENHGDGRAQFNVFASREKGDPWGTYSVEPAIKNENTGADVSQGMLANKVSCVSTDVASDTVMLAGLRFHQGMQVPTAM